MELQQTWTRQRMKLMPGLVVRLPSGNLVRLDRPNGEAHHYWACVYLEKTSMRAGDGVTLRIDWLERYGMAS